MKNKTVILILSVLAVAIYTTAVINFCLGNVLGGIADFAAHRQHILTDREMYERAKEWYR